MVEKIDEASFDKVEELLDTVLFVEPGVFDTVLFVEPGVFDTVLFVEPDLFDTVLVELLDDILYYTRLFFLR
jgi:hypothetical protein